MDERLLTAQLSLATSIRTRLRRLTMNDAYLDVQSGDSCCHGNGFQRVRSVPTRVVRSFKMLKAGLISSKIHWAINCITALKAAGDLHQSVHLINGSHHLLSERLCCRLSNFRRFVAVQLSLLFFREEEDVQKLKKAEQSGWLTDKLASETFAFRFCCLVWLAPLNSNASRRSPAYLKVEL